MLLAGVEMKVGAFAALRVGIMLLPEGRSIWAPLIIVLAVINVVYGALIALIQSDFKYVIGFSSVSHMGLVLIGFASLNENGLMGAGMQMFSHGVMTAMFFAVVGMVYDRAHTREIAQTGRADQSDAIRGDRVHHRRVGFHGHAGIFRFCGRIPDLYGILAGITDRSDRGDSRGDHHRGIYFTGHRPCFLRPDPGGNRSMV